MKILIVHNRYRYRGGEDTVYETERDMLLQDGQEVICYEKNNKDIDENSGKFALFIKTIWNKDSYREISELIDKEKPDIVHCHNIFPQISPSIYYACKKKGVPVVQTLHNYRLTCLNGYLFDDRKLKICEKCLGRLPIVGVFKKCYRRSLAASFTVACMLIFHRMIGTWKRYVDTYIVLTEFSREKFIKAGLPKEKLVVKPNAVPEDF